MSTGNGTIEILQELCEAIGVSGYEDDVRSIIEHRVKNLVDEMRVDALGNLICIRKCPKPDAPTLLLDAHMDEIGLVVSYVEPTGFLRFATVGGWDERVLPAHGVTIVTREGRRIRGVLGVPPPHIQRDEDRKRPYAVHELFIDIGATSREDVTALGIRVGDSAVISYPFHFENGVVIARALDDRAGCAIQIRVLQELAAAAPLDVNVAAVFSTFEETGARGAKVAAFGIDPQVALVFEGTTAGDFPGIPEAKSPCRQGRGPVLTILDKTAHCSPKVVRLLEKLADSGNIPYQIKTPTYGGTDAARIHIERAGILTGVLSVPCRYIHSPHSTLREDDLENCVRLAVAFARNCSKVLP